LTTSRSFGPLFSARLTADLRLTLEASSAVNSMRMARRTGSANHVHRGPMMAPEPASHAATLRGRTRRDLLLVGAAFLGTAHLSKPHRLRQCGSHRCVLGANIG